MLLSVVCKGNWPSRLEFNPNRLRVAVKNPHFFELNIIYNIDESQFNVVIELSFSVITDVVQTELEDKFQFFCTNWRGEG